MLTWLVMVSTLLPDFNRLYCVRIWVGGGGLRIGVVGWLFVLQLAK